MPLIISCKQYDINTYPNPLESLVELSSYLAITEVQVFDMQGRLVNNTSFDSEKLVEIDLGYLKTGVYMMKVNELGGEMSSVKLIKL